MNQPGVSFHGSTIWGISRAGDSICLSLEDVYIDGELKTSSVCFEGVKEIFCDRESVNELKMQFDDGEIPVDRPMERFSQPSLSDELLPYYM